VWLELDTTAFFLNGTTLKGTFALDNASYNRAAVSYRHRERRRDRVSSLHRAGDHSAWFGAA